MFPLADPLLLGPKPETAQEKARSQAVEELREFSKKVIGHNIPPYLNVFIEKAIDGPKRRSIEGTETLPKGGTFETDRDALYCKCGQLYESHDDPRVFCDAARKAAIRENFDPFATIGYLNHVEKVEEQNE